MDTVNVKLKTLIKLEVYDTVFTQNFIFVCVILPYIVFVYTWKKIHSIFLLQYFFKSKVAFVHEIKLHISL